MKKLIILICLLGILTIPFSAFATANVRKGINSWCQDNWQTNGYLNKDQCAIEQHKAVDKFTDDYWTPYVRSYVNTSTLYEEFPNRSKLIALCLLTEEDKDPHERVNWEVVLQCAEDGFKLK